MVPAFSRGRGAAAFDFSLQAAFSAASRFPLRFTPVGLPVPLELGISALDGFDSSNFWGVEL